MGTSKLFPPNLGWLNFFQWAFFRGDGAATSSTGTLEKGGDPMRWLRWSVSIGNHTVQLFQNGAFRDLKVEASMLRFAANVTSHREVFELNFKTFRMVATFWLRRGVCWDVGELHRVLLCDTSLWLMEEK